MKRLLSAFLSLLLAIQPATALWQVYLRLALTVAPVILYRTAWAQTSVDEGRTLGRSLLGNRPQTSMSGNTFTTTVGPRTVTNDSSGTSQSIFQTHRGEQNDVDAAKANYGNQSAWGAAIGTTSSRLAGEASDQGDAYRLLRDGGPTLPISEISPAALANSTTELSAPFTGCTTSETTVVNSNTVSLDVEKQCDRYAQPFTSCEVTRDILFHVPLSGTPGMSVTSCGPNCYDLYAESEGPNAGGGGFAFETNSSFTFNVDNTSVAVAWIHQRCDDGCELKVDTTTIEMIGAWKETSDWHNGAYIDLIPYMAGRDSLTLSWHSATWGGGGGRLYIHVEASENLIEDRGFIQSPPGCLDTLRASTLCSTGATWRCNNNTVRDVMPNTPLTPTNAASFGLTSGEIYSGEWADGTICWNARTDNACRVGAGSLCWTDANGTQQCAASDGAGAAESAAAECRALADSGCLFRSEACAGNGVDPATGQCFMYTQTWTCPGPTTEVATGATSATSISCSAMKCMGTECTIPQNETNTDFAMATASIGALDSMPMDTTCDVSGCTIFNGKPYECKKLPAGIVNCCDSGNPGPAGPVEYATAIYSAYQKAMDLGIIEYNNPIQGAANMIQNGVTDAMSAVTEPLMTAYDSVVSSATTALGGPSTSAMSSAVDSIGTNWATLGDVLTDQVAQWTADVFGEGVRDALFQEVTSTLGGSTYTIASDGFLATLSTAFSVITWAYLIITIVYACEADEFELNMKKELRQCHYIGDYCNDALCFEKRRSYCCFESALSRIMQEQIRKQPAVARDWGTPENPNCSGFSAAQLATVDMSQVDLTEWIALLRANGSIPDPAQIAAGGMDTATRVIRTGPNTVSGNAEQRFQANVGTNPNAAVNTRNQAATTIKPSM
jgi:conjugal transfer mating pair stabilization protein TraN